jgi:hypothetical protein
MGMEAESQKKLQAYGAYYESMGHCPMKKSSK